jgi:hypothetical protein
MVLFKNKKGDIFSLITLVLILIILVSYGVKVSSRECSSNADCRDNQYCGSDYKCHNLRTITVYKQDLILPSIIIAIALIAGAVILKKKKQPEQQSQYNYQTEYQQENPYYK